MKVLIVDDHHLFRSGLVSVLKKFDFITSINEENNGKEAIEELKRSKDYDIVFMDINMPVMNGADTTRIIKRDFPDVKVIVLTMYDDQKHVLQMVEAGASAYIIKDTTKDELKTAILKVINNELFFSKQVSESLITSIFFKSKNQHDQQSDQISKREKEILYLICKEYTTKEIASSLYLSEKTVDWHRLHLLQKTNSKNTAGLVMFAIKNGLIEDLVRTA